MQHSIWTLGAATLVLALLLICREQPKNRISRWFLKDKKPETKTGLSVFFWILAAALLLVIMASAIAIVLSEEGVQANITLDDIQAWLLSSGIPVLLIIIVSFVLYRLVSLAIPRLVEKYLKLRAKGRHSRLWYQNRTQTLATVLTTTAGAVIGLIAVFMLLGEFGVNITPLLAGAGVLGVAIGFGAQSLIKDFISGLFIFLEDHYNKGDVVEVAGRVGTVEEINLRRTVLRDLDGIVHSIPNGEISTSSNYTRDWARVKLDVPVAYGEDLDKVFEVLNRVGQELAADQVFGPKIKTPPQVLRVQNFGDSGIDIRILGEVKPIEQWTVTGELRRRIKKAFDEEGIEIPWPHVKLYLGQDKSHDSSVLCTSCSVPASENNRYCGNCGSEIKKTEQDKS